MERPDLVRTNNVNGCDLGGSGWLLQQLSQFLKMGMRLALYASLVMGAAALAGCAENDLSKPRGDELENAQVFKGEEADQTDAASAMPDTGVDDLSTADLPADWVNWGVSLEVAEARWDYLLHQVEDMRKTGKNVTNYRVNEDGADSYTIVYKDSDSSTGYSGGTGLFPHGNNPPLYDSELGK